AHVERAPVDEPEVAVVGDDAPALVRRDVAAGEENAERVRRLVGEPLGRAAGGGDAVERGLLVPRPAARLPAEVDPAAVVGPADRGGLGADELRPAHDAGYAELERAGGRGRGRRLLGVSGTGGRQGDEGQDGRRAETVHGQQPPGKSRSGKLRAVYGAPPARGKGQSPKEMPRSRAVATMSESSGTRFSSRTASSSGTARTTGGSSATMVPKRCSATRRTAAAPKRRDRKST